MSLNLKTFDVRRGFLAAFWKNIEDCGNWLTLTLNLFVKDFQTAV